MTSVHEILGDHQAAGALHRLVGIEAAVTDDLFLTVSGELVQFLEIGGIDPECKLVAQRDLIARQFEAAARHLGFKVRLYQYLIKESETFSAPPDRGSPVINTALKSRVDHLNSRDSARQRHRIYFVLVHEGWRDLLSQRQSGSVGARLRRRFSATATLTDLDSSLDRAAAEFAVQSAAFLGHLGAIVSVRTLSCAEAFAVLRRLLNYDPAKADAVGLAYNDAIAFQLTDSDLECNPDHLRLDGRYVQVLTLKVPPSRTYADMFHALLRVPGGLILVNEWRREPDQRVISVIRSKRRHHNNVKTSLVSQVSTPDTTSRDALVDTAAVARIDELGTCLEEVAVNGRHFGLFSMTIVLHGESLREVRRAVAECEKICGASDAHLTVERYNQLNAWLSVLPGNGARNLRRLWLLNTNYADLSFLFAPDRGRPWNDRLNDESLAVLESNDGGAYYFNLHHDDVAHALITGATGSGKSFLVNFLITQGQKYGPFTCIFDLGGSYEHLTSLLGGSLLKLGLQQQRINPFRLPATPENRHFLHHFVRVLVEASDYRLTAKDDRDLAEAIENVYSTDADQHRLLTLANIVNKHIRTHLLKWVQGGTHANFFDNVEDTLSISRFQTFDFEGMDRYPDVIEPLLFYVLHRANATILDPDRATQLKLFFVDEAWRFFRHPTVRAYLVEALKTWRKKNAAMVIATQSADDLVRSELLPTVLESCPTRLFLANPGMDAKAYAELFGLNATETDLVRHLVPKRQFLIKTPSVAKVVNLDVDAKSYWLYTNSPQDNIRRRRAFDTYGIAHGLDILARSEPS